MGRLAKCFAYPRAMLSTLTRRFASASPSRERRRAQRAVRVRTPHNLLGGILNRRAAPTSTELPPPSAPTATDFTEVRPVQGPNSLLLPANVSRTKTRP